MAKRWVSSWIWPTREKTAWIALNADLLALRRDKGPGPVPVVLHHPEHGMTQAQALQHPHRHLGVGDAAVDEERSGLSENFSSPSR